jgi:DNA-binding response OmpR family regulator
VLEPAVHEKNPPPDWKPGLGLKALIVARDLEMIRIFSYVFRERGIDARKCALESAALDQLSSEKFEAIILDFDEIAGCPNILKSLPGANKRVPAFAVASDSHTKQVASDLGASFVVERPLALPRIRDLLRSAYGQILREGQNYFRLAVELSVSIRRGSGALLQCTTLNLSQTGMAVNSSSTFTIGEQINIAFAIPNTDVFVGAEGKVVWDDKHGKTGISFECANASIQSRLNEWLQGHFFMRQSDVAEPDASE